MTMSWLVGRSRSKFLRLLWRTPRRRMTEFFCDAPGTGRECRCELCREQPRPMFASIRSVRYRCRHHMRALSIILGICATVALQAHENWPQFRGPNADGKSDAKGLPVQWSDTEHVKWKTATPVGHKG